MTTHSAHRYRIAALDIDGTILDSAGRVSAELKDVLLRLKDGGVRTVLCTGRRWRSALPVFEELEHACSYVVCCGGALVKESDQGGTLYANPIEQATARRCGALFRQCGLVPFFLFDSSPEEPELLVSQEDQHRAASVPYLHANREAVDYFQGPYPPDGRRCLVVYTVDAGSRVRASQYRMEQAVGEDGIVKVMAQPRYGADQVAIEVHGPTATKWSALQWLLRRWEVKSREVVAVGDDVNDIPMLRAAGLSFAMGNASDEVKAAASAVTASNDEHGVAEALRSAFKELIPNGARRGT